MSPRITIQWKRLKPRGQWTFHRSWNLPPLWDCSGNHAAPPQFQASAPLSARFNNRTRLRLFQRTFSSYQCHVSKKNTQRCYMSFPPEDMELVINIIWIYSLLLSNFFKNILWSLDLFNKNKVSLIFFKYEN